MPLNDPICRTVLAGSIARTMLVFHEYHAQLGQVAEAGLTEEFFDRFIRTWGLARTIGKDKRKTIREKLVKSDLRRLKDGNAGTVDKIASEYRELKLSAKTGGKKKSYRTPRSLLSKMAFLAKPTLFVPYDTYAKNGLNNRRGSVRDNGCGYLADDYVSYFDSFEKCYSKVKNDIVHGCSKKWVSGLADELHINREWCCSDAFYRKVLDGVLMTEGGRSE